MRFYANCDGFIREEYVTRNVAIVHFNTPELTRAAIQSVQRHTPGCHFTVFDNSDCRPFKPMRGVRIIDNTKGQFINFDAMLARYPKRESTSYYQASAKHIASVDYLFDVIPEGFVLMDSDVLVKKDIAPFFDPMVAWSGSEEWPKVWYQTVRLSPYLLWINVPLCKRHGIRFWHEGMVYKLSHNGAPFYDTGGSFFKDCKDAGLRGRELDIYEYIEHYGGASYTKDKQGPKVWLEAHKELWWTKRYLVVIPYLPAAAQGRELEYAISGWRKHFQSDYLIVVVGEGLPKLDGDDVVCIESKRVDDIPGQYRQHLDYVSCFKKVHEAFPDTDGFVFVADDCYAMRDFYGFEVMEPKMQGKDFNYSPDSPNEWQQDKMRTKRVLQEAGLPTRNYTTHLPVWFEWDKIEELWRRYDMLHNSYVIEDLYFNTYHSKDVTFLLNPNDPYKYCVSSKSPNVVELHKAILTKAWLTNTPDGWSAELDKLLREHYKDVLL